MAQEGMLEHSSTLKGLAVLDSIARAGRSITLSDLMRATGLPKASLHRTLSLFEEAGYLRRERGGRAYAIGPRLVSLGLAVLTHDVVSTERRTILRSLVAELGESCNFAVLRKAEVVYLDRVQAEWPLRLHLPVGGTIPPHCSASGKLLMALAPNAQRDELLATLALQGFTRRTITDRALLARELDRIASTGYAVEDEEYVAGIACVAVPVLAGGKAVAAVAVHAATARMPLQQAVEYVPRLTSAAEAIAGTIVA